jgi:hypothetical protein
MSILDEILLPTIQAESEANLDILRTGINLYADLEDIYTGQSVTRNIQINPAGDYREFRFPLIFEQLIVNQNSERDFDFTVNVFSKIHPRFIRVNQYDLLIQLEVGTTCFLHLDQLEVEIDSKARGKAGQITVIPNLGIPQANRTRGKLYIWWVSFGCLADFDGGYDPILLDILNYGDQLNYRTDPEETNLEASTRINYKSVN